MAEMGRSVSVGAKWTKGPNLTSASLEEGVAVANVEPSTAAPAPTQVLKWWQHCERSIGRFFSLMVEVRVCFCIGLH
jgi:hypothetical protein